MTPRSIRATSLLVALILPAATLAEENPWIPAFSAFGGILTQKLEATSTNDATWPVATVAPAGGNSAGGEDVGLQRIEGDAEMTYPLVGFSAELMTPKLPLPGRPALFVHGDVAMSFSSTWQPASVGEPGDPGFYLGAVEGGAAINPAIYGPGDLNNTGIATSAEAETLEISAGAGISFETKLWDRTLRLRPSFEYRREQISYGFVLSNGVTYEDSIFCGPPPAVNPGDEYLNGCGLASLSGGAKKTFHSIGPGFEVEMDAGRSGPLVLSLYISAQAYRILGSRSTTIQTSGDFAPPPPPGSSVAGTINATATFEQEPWSYRGLVGLRFRWLPE